MFNGRGVTGRADTRRRGRFSLTTQVGGEVSQPPLFRAFSTGRRPHGPFTPWILCSGVGTLDVVVAYPVLYPASRDVAVRAEVERANC